MLDIPDVLELTRELIRIQTVNPPGDELKCARFIAGILDGAGFEMEFHTLAEGRANLIARLPGDSIKPPLGFTGHMDTVPLGLAEWSFDPFAAEVADGKLLGRGASDMKSGVAAIVVAALRHAAQTSRRGDLILLLTAGEETGCQGAARISEAKLVPERLGALVVAEPTSNYPMLGHKGALWFEVITRGVTAHGSMPELGDNAIHKAAEAVLKLRDFQFSEPPHPILGRATLNVGNIHGGLNINSVPDEAKIGVDVRTLPEQDNDDLVNDFASKLGAGAEVKVVSNSASVWTNADDPWIGEVFDIMTGILGETPEPRSVPFFTDASALDRAFGHPPIVIMGPGETGMAHQTDEFCYVERIYQAVEAYAAIMERWSD